MKMYLIAFIANVVSAGFYQRYRFLSSIEKTDRQSACIAKAEETKNQFKIEKGSWNCPDIGKKVSKLKCFPTCDAGMKPDWKLTPKKARPRFLVRCGDPPTVARKNLPEETELSCSPLPIHPCVEKAAQIPIEDGKLELKSIINKVRATFNLICDDSQKMGSLYCFNKVFKRPKWNKVNWKESCKKPCDTDPCTGQENCQTFVNGCAADPKENNSLGKITHFSNSFRISAEIFCVDGQDRELYKVHHILHVSGSDSNFSPLFEITSENHHGNSIFLAAYLPTKQQHYFFFDQECTPGQWNTYSYELNRIDAVTRHLSFYLDEKQIKEQTIDCTQIYCGGGDNDFNDHEVFMSLNNISEHFTSKPATGSFVRNFFFQNISPKKPCATDPCSGKENCQTFVDGCALDPKINNYSLGKTLPISAHFKISAEIFCTHGYSDDDKVLGISGSDKSIPLFDITSNSYKPGDYHSITIITYTPTFIPIFDAHKHHCEPGEWNTYSYEYKIIDSEKFYKIYRVDGEKIMEYTWDCSIDHFDCGKDNLYIKDTNITDHEAYLSLNQEEDYFKPATGSFVRNFFFQNL